MSRKKSVFKNMGSGFSNLKRFFWNSPEIVRFEIPFILTADGLIAPGDPLVMIIIEIHYSSLNFKVPLPHKLVSWRLNVRTWPLALGAFYRILTMERKWQEPPGGGGADLWSQSDLQNLSFRVLRRKPCLCRYNTIMIVQWRIQTFRRGWGGWGSSRPWDKGGRSFSFSFNPSFSLVPRSPSFQCKTEWDLGPRFPIFLLLAAISPVLCRFLKATLLVRILP